MRFVVEEVDNLPGHELTRLANTNRKLAGRTFGDSNITVILGELDGEGTYNQDWQMRGDGGEYDPRPCFATKRPNDAHRRRQHNL